MNNLKYLLAVLLVWTTVSVTSASVHVCIANQEINGDELSFDLFLSTEAEGEVAYLSNSDFVFTLEGVDLEGLTFTKVSTEGMFDKGYCELTSSLHTDGGALTTMIDVQKPYFDNTQTAIVGNLLVVNVYGLTINTEQDLKTRGARIDHRQATHRLGRFKVSGIANPLSKIKFSASSGLKTKMFGHDVLDANLRTKGLEWKECTARKPMSQAGDIGDFELVLSPNPTADKVQISIIGAEEKDHNYHVYSMEGRNFASGVLTHSNSNILNLEAAPSGVYLLKVEGQQAVYKVVKQ